jgi:TPR repeat protein
MSSATMARARSTALIALLCFCSPSLAAQAEDVTPAEAELRSLAIRDPAQQEPWLKIAAEGGRRDAQWVLGERYLLAEAGKGKNAAAGIELLRRSAAQGSSRAQSLLGWAYWGGVGVKKDLAEAAKWFTAAARQEDGYALASLAGFYYRGTGVVQDRARGKRLLLRAAELGDDKGLTGAWNVLLVGKPEDRDQRLGMHFLNKAASANDANAAYALAREYLTGRDVARDPSLAVVWFERAAKAKHALASLWLSELHAKGIGVRQDVKRAEQMLEDALSSAKLKDKNLFSWTLSVAQDAQLRNSTLAIRVLEPALAAEKEKSPAYLDTLAAAYADHGDFDKAVSTQLEALQAARRKWPTQPATSMEQRLELYRTGKAYREDML